MAKRRHRDPRSMAPSKARSNYQISALGRHQSAPLRISGSSWLFLAISTVRNRTLVTLDTAPISPVGSAYRIYIA